MYIDIYVLHLATGNKDGAATMSRLTKQLFYHLMLSPMTFAIFNGFTRSRDCSATFLAEDEVTKIRLKVKLFSACFARSFCGWKMMEPKTIASWLSASFCPNNKRGYQLSDFSKTTYHLSAFVILNRKCNTNHNTPSISKIKFSTSQKWYSCN